MKPGQVDSFHFGMDAPPMEPPVPFMFMLRYDDSAGYHRARADAGSYHRGRDKFEVLATIREFVESMPETGGVFKMTNIDGYEASSAMHQDLAKIIGTWPLDDDHRSRGDNWVNPNYVHSHTHADLEDRDDIIGWFYQCAMMRMPLERAAVRADMSRSRASDFIYDHCPFSYREVKKVAVRRWGRTWHLARAQGTEVSTIAKGFDVDPETVHSAIGQHSQTYAFDPDRLLREVGYLAIAGSEREKEAIVEAVRESPYDVAPREVQARADAELSEYMTRQRLKELAEQGVLRETRNINTSQLYDIA